MSEEIADTGSSFKDYFEYSAFIMLAGILRFLPLAVAVRIGELFARIFCAASMRSSRFIRYQMQECFGDRYTENEYKQLVRKFYRHFGCLFAEAVRLKTINNINVNNIVDWNGIDDEIDRLTERYGKGVFLATGHIGNWEFTGCASAVKGFLAGSIARPLDNHLIDAKVKAFREYSGQKIWDKNGALVKLLQAFKRKKSVGVLIDQDGGEQGLRVPFLGRPASTNTAVIEMSIRLGVPILPCAMVRDGSKPMNFKVVFGEPVIAESRKITMADIYRLAEKVNNELSAIIAANPEQWLWIHKRWKTPNPIDIRHYKKYE